MVEAFLFNSGQPSKKNCVCVCTYYLQYRVNDYCDDSFASRREGCEATFGLLAFGARDFHAHTQPQTQTHTLTRTKFNPNILITI